MVDMHGISISSANQLGTKLNKNLTQAFCFGLKTHFEIK